MQGEIATVSELAIERTHYLAALPTIARHPRKWHLRPYDSGEWLGDGYGWSHRRL